MASSYLSDFEHRKLEAKVLPGTVLETYYISDATTGQRRVPKTKAWKVGRSLGEGSFGEVHVRLEVCANEKRAVKRIWTSGSVLKNRYERELKALLEFSKPKYKEAAVFVEFFGWFEDPDSVYLTMEYLPLGDLEDNVPPKPGVLKEAEIRDIVSQVLQGLRIMHLENFVHRDLKPKNILVCRPSPRWWVKLADFGLSKRKTEDTAYRTQAGTQAYMAPELLNLAPGVDLDSSEYTNAVDMWAMGCVLYRLVLGCVPFPPGPSLVRFCENITSLPLDELPLSPPGITFLKDLLIPSPSARLTAQEALDHTWTTIRTEIDNPSKRRLPALEIPVLAQSNIPLPASFQMYNTTSHVGLESHSSSFLAPSSSQGDGTYANTPQKNPLLSGNNLQARSANDQHRKSLYRLNGLQESPGYAKRVNDDRKEERALVAGFDDLSTRMDDVLSDETVKLSARSQDLPKKNDQPAPNSTAAGISLEQRKRRANKSKMSSGSDNRSSPSGAAQPVIPFWNDNAIGDSSMIGRLTKPPKTSPNQPLSKPFEKATGIEASTPATKESSSFSASMRETLGEKVDTQTASTTVQPGTSRPIGKFPKAGWEIRDVPLHTGSPVSKPQKRQAETDGKLEQESEPKPLVRRRERKPSQSLIPTLPSIVPKNTIKLPLSTSASLGPSLSTKRAKAATARRRERRENRPPSPGKALIRQTDTANRRSRSRSFSPCRTVRRPEVLTIRRSRSRSLSSYSAEKSPEECYYRRAPRPPMSPTYRVERPKLGAERKRRRSQSRSQSPVALENPIQQELGAETRRRRSHSRSRSPVALENLVFPGKEPKPVRLNGRKQSKIRSRGLVNFIGSDIHSLPSDGSPITISRKSKGIGNVNGLTSDNKSRKPLLIEYFEGGKDGQADSRRPSVRVETTPSSKPWSWSTGDHVQIVERKGTQEPSYTRRTQQPPYLNGDKSIEGAGNDSSQITERKDTRKPSYTKRSQQTPNSDGNKAVDYDYDRRSLRREPEPFKLSRRRRSRSRSRSPSGLDFRIPIPTGTEAKMERAKHAPYLARISDWIAELPHHEIPLRARVADSSAGLSPFDSNDAVRNYRRKPSTRIGGLNKPRNIPREGYGLSFSKGEEVQLAKDQTKDPKGIRNPKRRDSKPGKNKTNMSSLSDTKSPRLHHYTDSDEWTDEDDGDSRHLERKGKHRARPGRTRRLLGGALAALGQGFAREYRIWRRHPHDR